MTSIILTNIKLLCEIKGITLIDLARQVGIGERYFTKPHEDLSVNLVSKVAEYFEVKPGDLLEQENINNYNKILIKNKIQSLQRELNHMEVVEDAKEFAERVTGVEK